MASDIYFNGTTYPGRAGADKYGTMYYTVKPADLVGSLSPALDVAWGSRLAEMSGRVRGLSAVGTLTTEYGTIDIDFPVGFFTFPPITKISALVNGVVAHTDWERFSKQYYVFPNETLFYSQVLAGYQNLVGIESLGIVERFVSASHLTICRVGVSTSDQYRYANVGNPIVVYWHAFGI